MKATKRIITVILAMVMCASMMCVPIVNAATKHLNIDVYMDGSYINKNGVPGAFQTQYSNLTTAVKAMYIGAFGITLDFNFVQNNQRIIDSPADNCPDIGIYFPDSTNSCECVSNLQCIGGVNTHCTDVDRVRTQIWNGWNVNSVQLLFTAHKICATSASAHGYAVGVCVKPAGGTYNGAYVGQLECMDYLYDDGDETNPDYAQARATVAHEIGHLYGALDHTAAMDAQNPNCIWGANRRTPRVSNTFMMCSTCTQTIRNNASRFSHS